jgi:hypothetical protein
MLMEHACVLMGEEYFLQMASNIRPRAFQLYSYPIKSGLRQFMWTGWGLERNNDAAELWYLHIRSLVGLRGIDHGEDTLAARKRSRRASDSSSSGTCLSPEALNINENFFKTRSEMEGFI